MIRSGRVTPPDPSIGPWRKSSHSGGGNDCVEVAWAGRPAGDGMLVRDSKNADGPRLGFGPAAWAAFVDGVS